MILHFEDLCLAVGIVRDVDKVLHLWRIDLLVLRRHQHASNTYQLQVTTLDLDFFKVSIDKAHRQEQGLRQEFEFQVHLNDPVDEDCPHLFVDVALVAHIVH